MNTPVLILYLEDNPRDAELVRDKLQQTTGIACELQVASDRAEYEVALAQTRFDLILSDYGLPNYDGMAALAWVRAKQPDVPFILVSGTLGEEQAVDCVLRGATDYVLKQRLDRLVPAVVRALTEAEEHQKRRKAEAALRESEDQFRAIFELASVGIAQADIRTGQWLRVNQKMCAITGYSADELLRLHISHVTHPDDRQSDWAAFQRVVRGEQPDYRMEKRYIRKDGSLIWVNVNMTVIRDAAGQPARTVAAIEDITVRKQAQAALEKAHQELIDASRQAGMAEFATGVLHNIGNVLNSVGVASTCVADNLRRSKSANLAKVVALLRDHQADLGDFLTNDPRGKSVFEYLAQLAGQLAAEQAAVLQELAGLQKNITHIKEVVLTQQTMAIASGVSETFDITELVEDAVRMNASNLAHRGIQVIRQFEEVPPFTIEKNKVLQILVNLVRNAEQAYVNSDHKDKTLTLRVTRNQDRVRVAISDNGVGIPPENLEQIFTYGFTTKKDGHGFGLCSCAVAAREIGGSLTVHSDGPGQGATFTLEIPVPPTGGLR